MGIYPVFIGYLPRQIC